ncbi:MAG: WecB/TagA/CpsF family glycosyltransferase [Defluviitaleaceae bacterium]|nr:WecB/TagA/CpsF family glycosyltransferase [Defluviitaleaceae bacterium]
MNTNERHSILQVPFNGLTMDDTLQVLLNFIKTDVNHLVVTPNPEAVMLAQRDKTFLQVLQSADLVLPDGIGILLAARWLKLNIPCRVPGCDITMALLDAAKGHSCYLLGAAPGIAEMARRNLQNKNIIVLGAKDGYFDEDMGITIMNEIKELKPDILIVGMGMPKQEIWALKHLHTLPCKITLCVGGSIDIMAGNIKRAPKIMRRLGLEWLFRLITQPSRAKRMPDLPKFVFKVMKVSKHMFT